MSDTTDNKVIIYSTSSCAFCHTEKQWLDAIGVKYVSKDIEQDPEAKEELLAKLDGNYQGVPTTDIGGQMIVGFDRPKLTAALEANGLVK